MDKLDALFALDAERQQQTTDTVTRVFAQAERTLSSRQGSEPEATPRANLAGHARRTVRLQPATDPEDGLRNDEFRFIPHPNGRRYHHHADFVVANHRRSPGRDYAIAATPVYVREGAVRPGERLRLLALAAELDARVKVWIDGRWVEVR